MRSSESLPSLIHSAQSNGSGNSFPTTWSAAAEEDLLANIGPRERARQEALWEIVMTEERYVQELLSLQELFIEPLLHPFSSHNSPSPPRDSNRLPSPTLSDEWEESIDSLPIASRFVAPLSLDSLTIVENASTGDRMNNGDIFADEYALMHERRNWRVRFGDGQQTPRRKVTSTASEPQIPNLYDRKETSRSTTSLSFRIRDRLRRSFTQGRLVDRTSDSPVSLEEDAIPPHLLPKELKRCLEVVEELMSTRMMSEGLTKRYDDEFPLIRTVSDVLAAHLHTLRSYTDYVLNLERALGQIDHAINTAAKLKAQARKGNNETDWFKTSRYIYRLDEIAFERGQTGLAISICKPFRRLLRYPLLLRNLLYHTDPSTFEYESVLQLVAEVEAIIRDIEGEKSKKDDRERTRDALGRIKGIKQAKGFTISKQNRVLIDEKPLNPTAYVLTPVRSPELESNVGKKDDIWFVAFSDVTLRCQRTGSSSLTHTQTSALEGLPLRTKRHNLYKFLAIESWNLDGILKNAEIVEKAEIAHVHKQSAYALTSEPNLKGVSEEPLDSDDESDRASEMSFAYWGADKVTVYQPSAPDTPNGRSKRRDRQGDSSAANAKFGTRLLPVENRSNRRSPSRNLVTPTSQMHVSARRVSDSFNETASNSLSTALNSDSRSESSTTVGNTETVSSTSTLRPVGPLDNKSSPILPLPTIPDENETLENVLTLSAFDVPRESVIEA